MMRCFDCHKEFHTPGILISADGDFVCSESCKQSYEKKKDHFFNAVQYDDSLMNRWWAGEDFPVT